MTFKIGEPISKVDTETTRSRGRACTLLGTTARLKNGRPYNITVSDFNHPTVDVRIMFASAEK